MSPWPRHAVLFFPAQVSLTVLSAILVPVAVSWALTGPLLRALGEPAEVADDASYYALVLMACLPARIGISQISQFFTSQKMLHPGMTTGFLAMLMNLVLGLYFVLGVPSVPAGWAGLGFHACPLVTSAVEYCQLALLWGVYWAGLKLYRECWPEAGWSWSHVTRARVAEFCRIYFPAALSLASDFWRVAAIGAVAATLGAAEVSVFNCSYRIMWIALTFIGSMGGAMAIHLGVALGAGDTAAAKLSARVCIATCCVAVVGLAAVMMLFARDVARLFSPDPAIQVLSPATLHTPFMADCASGHTLNICQHRCAVALYLLECPDLFMHYYAIGFYCLHIYKPLLPLQGTRLGLRFMAV